MVKFDSTSLLERDIDIFVFVQSFCFLCLSVHPFIHPPIIHPWAKQWSAKKRKRKNPVCPHPVISFLILSLWRQGWGEPILQETQIFCTKGFWSIPLYGRFPGGSDGNESACNSGRPGFDSWVRKIPWRRAWQRTPVFLPGESPWTEEPGRLQSMGLQRVRHD